MNYLSDNGVKTYNLCHCAFPTPPFPPIAHVTQSGAILRWPISTSGAAPPTPPPSSSSNRVAISTMRSVGHSSPLRLPYLTVSFWLRQRWGDVPVHSIAAALFGEKDRIHFLREMGYEHAPYTVSCRGEHLAPPGALYVRSRPELWCVPALCRCFDWLTSPVIDYDGYSCLWKMDTGECDRDGLIWYDPIYLNLYWAEAFACFSLYLYASSLSRYRNNIINLRILYFVRSLR